MTDVDEPSRIPVKEAIRTAKEVIADIVEESDLRNLGVEEVKFDQTKRHWLITLGFNRPWNVIREEKAPALPGGRSLRFPFEEAPIKKRLRTYKTIRIDGASGDFIAMEGRDE